MAALAVAAVLMSCDKNNPVDGGFLNGASDYETLQAKSLKRGVSFNFNQLAENDIPLLGPACSWSYNWGISMGDAASGLFDKYGMDYCPMAWNTNWSEDSFRAFKRAHPGCEYILAYNEPNLTDQANMTPAEAAKDWPRLVAIARELDMKIIAPAMNYGTFPGYEDPWKWYDEFFAQDGVSLDDVSGVALHCYMGSAGSMKQYVDKFKKYGKPIWLTEFCNWAGNNISVESQMKYMVEAINKLEADPDVQRYAWFIPRGNGEAQCHNSLLASSKPFGLTDLGKVFVNMSTQDKALYYKPSQVIPAEHYNACEGDVHLAPCSDSKGVLELTDLKKGSSVTYNLEVEESGTYTFEIRYYTGYPCPMTISVDGTSIGSLTLSNTADKWSNIHADIALEAGRHTVTLSNEVAFPIAINWLRFTK